MRNRGLIYLIISLTCFFIATSCNTEKRLQKAEVLLATKGRLPEVCATRFPPKDSIVYRDSVRFDTLYTSIYSIDTIVSNDTIKIVTVLPSKLVTKEVIRFRDIYRENTAKVTDLQNKNAECSAKKSEYEKQTIKLKADADMWEVKARVYFWFLWFIIIISLIIIFRKRIFKFVKLFL